jgi:acetyl esterase/lipase
MQSQDDTLVDSSLAYYIALKAAGVPSELHLYASGGHGYGLMRTGRPTDAWAALAIHWFGREVMRSRAW